MNTDFWIRPATAGDLPEICAIYHHARSYMRQTGNPDQWTNGYPSEDLLRQDLAMDRLYICQSQTGIAGVFCYFQGADPTYNRIDGGQWLDDGPYGVIHRIAVCQHRQGVASFCFHWALEQCPSLRIDTHRDNLPMHRSLAKNGFSRCGIIYLANGDPRIAYQKTAAAGV